MKTGALVAAAHEGGPGSATAPRAARRAPAAGARRARSPRAPHVLTPPRVNAAVVAGEENLRHLPPAEVRRSRVVRVLESAVEGGREALDLARPLRARAGK